MKEENIILSSKPIEISEFPNHKEAIFLISVLDEYNLNGVLIEKPEGEKYHKTIIGYPILAYLKYDKNKQPSDFGGHELRKKYNSKTKEFEYYFATFPIGSVTDSWIEKREIEGYNGEKDVILIKTKLWKSRFPSYFEVFDKLWDNGQLSSSWEISPFKSEKTNKGKRLIDFEFIGNTCLGKTVQGAVPGAGVLEVAEQEQDVNDLLSQAFEKDIKLSEQDNNNINNKEEGGDVMEEIKENAIESEIVEEAEKEVIDKVEEIAEENKEEIEKSEELTEETEEIQSEVDNESKDTIESALTLNMLFEKLSKALNPKGWDGEEYFSAFKIYPEDHKVLCIDVFKEDDDAVAVFEYQVSNDEVSIVGRTDKKISDLFASNSEKAEVDAEKISILEKELSEVKVELEKITNDFNESAKAVSELMTEKSNLETQVSELGKYKEEAEKLEKAELDRQLEEKKTELSAFALEDGLISKEELKEEKLATIFSELTLDNFEDLKEKVEIFKSRKALAKFRAEKQGLDKEVQVSEKSQKTEKVKTDLNSEDDDKMLSATEVVKKAYNFR